MATSFPVSLDSLGNPSSGDTLNAPSHSTQHTNANDAIEVLEAKVGVDNSAVTTSLDYKVRIGNPVGEIAMWSTNTAPTGWLLCDGIDKDRSTYSALHSLMQAAGYPFGAGNGSTTFGIPNLLGKFPVGKDASADFDVLGETGGGKTRVLGVSNLPAHNHTGSASVTINDNTVDRVTRLTAQAPNGYATGVQPAVMNGLLAGTAAYGYSNTNEGMAVSYETEHTHTNSASVTIDTSGGNGTANGNSFSVLPPYIALNFIIRF
jgi:microcystin-dependent protein